MRLLAFTLTFLMAQGVFAMELPDDKAQRIKTFFQQLSIDTMDLNQKFYAPDIKFVDPLGTINGIDDLIGYYTGLYKNVDTIRFEFEDILVSGDKAFAPWVMYLKTPSLNSGEEYAVEGGSHFTFDSNNKVTYHRDYFDLGAFVYERVPVLKRIINYTKGRMKASH